MVSIIRAVKMAKLFYSFLASRSGNVTYFIRCCFTGPALSERKYNACIALEGELKVRSEIWLSAALGLSLNVTYIIIRAHCHSGETLSQEGGHLEMGRKIGGKNTK